MFRAYICPSSGVLGCIRVQPNTTEDGHIDARIM